MFDYTWDFVGYEQILGGPVPDDRVLFAVLNTYAIFSHVKKSYTAYKNHGL